MIKNKKQKGFTLIELLVVIVIIGIIATIIVAVLSNARRKGRDTERIREIKEIQTALQMFFSDNGFYPEDIYSLPSQLVETKTIPEVPKDPNNIQYNYIGTNCDVTDTTKCQNYHIGALLETENPILKSDSDIDTTSAGGFNGVENLSPRVLMYDIYR